MRKRLPAGLANTVVRLLACQQLLWQIQRLEEETARFSSLMRIYKDEMNRRFTETGDSFEFVQAGNHTIERIIFGVDRRYSSK